MKTHMRQRVRKSILMFSLIGIMYFLGYTCPIEMLHAAYYGVIGAPIIVYAVLFIFSIFFGRSFCGWVCWHGILQTVANRQLKIPKSL